MSEHLISHPLQALLLILFSSSPFSFLLEIPTFSIPHLHSAMNNFSKRLVKLPYLFEFPPNEKISQRSNTTRHLLAARH